MKVEEILKSDYFPKIELTSKCKEDFEEYFLNLNICYPEGFYTWTDSTQWGVLVDFFDSKDFEIAVKSGEGYYIWGVGLNVNNFYIDTKKTLVEARTEAIKKANELYNNY